MSLLEKLRRLEGEELKTAIQNNITHFNINIMVLVQILIDDIEELQELGLLRHTLKAKAKTFKDELERHNKDLYKRLTDDQKPDVNFLYETNFKWLKEFNSLDSNERLTVMEFIAAMRAGEVKKVNQYQFNKIREPKKKDI